MGAAFFAVQRRAGWERPALARMRALMRVGSHIAVRTTALLGAFLVASAVLARVGDAPLGAHQIAFQLFVFLALVLDALAIAAQVMVGRMLGAGDAAGARDAAGRMIAWSVALGAVFGVALLALGDTIPRSVHARRRRRRADARDLVAVRGADAAQRRGVRARRDPDRGRRHALPDVGDARRVGRSTSRSRCSRSTRAGASSACGAGWPRSSASGSRPAGSGSPRIGGRSPARGPYHDGVTGRLALLLVALTLAAAAAAAAQEGGGASRRFARSRSPRRPRPRRRRRSRRSRPSRTPIARCCS